jgi:mono/diheme cytochrome c family protein
VRLRAATLIILALLVAGCGAPKDGSRLFARECAGCHSLSGRERGAMGGDLAVLLLSSRDLVSFESVMPTPDRVSAAEAKSIAAYVRARELASRRRVQVSLR